MKSNRHILHPATIFLLLTVAVVFLSWIFDVYGWTVPRWQTGEEVHVQSLLHPEGIRWMLRNVVSNFTGFSPLGQGIVAFWGIGIALHSGFVQACCAKCMGLRTAGSHKLLSRKETRALTTALLAGLFYAVLTVWLTFSSQAILLSAVGTLQRSPFLVGLVFLCSLGVGLTGMVYGFSSGRYRTDTDVIEGMMHPVRLTAIYLVVSFFAAQMFACLEYTQLGHCLPIPQVVLYLPLFLSVCYYICLKTYQK